GQPLPRRRRRRVEIEIERGRGKESRRRLVQTATVGQVGWQVNQLVRGGKDFGRGAGLRAVEPGRRLDRPRQKRQTPQRQPCVGYYSAGHLASGRGRRGVTLPALFLPVLPLGVGGGSGEAVELRLAPGGQARPQLHVRQ